MPFENEKEFESYIRKLIKRDILSKDDSLILFENKRAVDILLCRNGDKSALFFLEIKYHKQKHGRLGFGSAKGIGFQPEILTKQPHYFRDNMRWILGIEGQDKEYWIVDNNTLSKYVSGGVVATKYNNIQKKIFLELPSATKAELVKTLKQWLKIKE